MSIQLVKDIKQHGGHLRQFVHESRTLNAPFRFTVYLPPASRYAELPWVLWLSGIQCTDENFVIKSGAQAVAAELSLVLVVPDTMPRGVGLQEEVSSFYVDATRPPFSHHVQMFTYLSTEFIDLVETVFPVIPGLRSISGHSMGGHGAILLAQKNPALFRSVSALAPLCSLTRSPTPEPSLLRLFKDFSEATEYDTLDLLTAPFTAELLIDVGTRDDFLLNKKLLVDEFVQKCRDVGQVVRYRRRPDYDHGYFFVSSFIREHLVWHAQRLTLSRPPRPYAVPLTPEGGAQPIICKAVICDGPSAPLRVADVAVAPAQSGEVRLKILETSLCHTDVYTWSGADPEGRFPVILGHEAFGVVESVGDGVQSLQPGDFVVPLYVPQCNSCAACLSGKTNLCSSIRKTQGEGVMPDGTSRFREVATGAELRHFMGVSSFAEFTVVPEIALAKLDDSYTPAACLLGCAVPTGWGAVWNTAAVTPGASVAVFGLGGVGLAVVQACKVAGAADIVAVDPNEFKHNIAFNLGATRCCSFDEFTADGDLTNFDFTFECTGNVDVMNKALEVSAKGWGVSVAKAGEEVHLVTGRQWRGTAFGGWRGRRDVPQLARRVCAGQLRTDVFVTHVFKGVDGVLDAWETMKTAFCVKPLVRISP